MKYVIIQKMSLLGAAVAEDTDEGRWICRCNKVEDAEMIAKALNNQSCNKQTEGNKKMKTKHDGDCTIYAALENGNPEDGICTCGFGRERVREGDYSEMYSEALQKKLSDVSTEGNKRGEKK